MYKKSIEINYSILNMLLKFDIIPCGSTNIQSQRYTVNSASIINNYKIGTIINQRKVWGNKYIERLSNDLKEYGEGYSYDSLKLKSRFAKEFTIDEIREQPVPQIPWGTIVEIMKKSKTHNEMLWYVKQTYKKGWGRSMVLNQFKVKAYERSLIEPETSPHITTSNELTNELFKDTYVFDFIDINKIRYILFLIFESHLDMYLVMHRIV